MIQNAFAALLFTIFRYPEFLFQRWFKRKKCPFSTRILCSKTAQVIYYIPLDKYVCGSQRAGTNSHREAESTRLSQCGTAGYRERFCNWLDSHELTVRLGELKLGPLAITIRRGAAFVDPPEFTLKSLFCTKLSAHPAKTKGPDEFHPGLRPQRATALRSSTYFSDVPHVPSVFARVSICVLHDGLFVPASVARVATSVQPSGALRPQREFLP